MSGAKIFDTKILTWATPLFCPVCGGDMTVKFPQIYAHCCNIKWDGKIGEGFIKIDFCSVTLEKTKFVITTWGMKPLLEFHRENSDVENSETHRIFLDSFEEENFSTLHGFYALCQTLVSAEWLL